MTKVLFYGDDFGNAEIDGVLLGGSVERVASMPTAEAVHKSGDQAKNFEVKYGPNTVTFRMANEATTYLIGEGAINQAKGAANQRGNIGRYTSPQHRRAMLSNAARLTTEKEFKLHVVTGVPVITYGEDTSNIRQRIIDALSGKYSFVLNGTDERHVEVVVEKVIAEGAGVIISHGDKGTVKQGVIDSGGRTLDLYVSRGQQPQLQMCKSITENVGVEAAIDHFKELYKQAYKVRLDDTDARMCMFSYVKAPGVFYQPLAAGGQIVNEYEVFDLVAEAVRVTGERVSAEVAGAWNNGETLDQVASDFKNIFVVGRGALYFTSFIRKVVAAAQLKMVEAPGSANAYGYAQLAKSTAMRNISTVAS